MSAQNVAQRTAVFQAVAAAGSRGGADAGFGAFRAPFRTLWMRCRCGAALGSGVFAKGSGGVSGETCSPVCLLDTGSRPVVSAGEQHLSNGVLHPMYSASHVRRR